MRIFKDDDSGIFTKAVEELKNGYSISIVKNKPRYVYPGSGLFELGVLDKDGYLTYEFTDGDVIKGIHYEDLEIEIDRLKKKILKPKELSGKI